MKALLKRLAGQKILLVYHRMKASLAAFIYGHPSNGLIIIGITGTKGKSTTANLLWAALTGAGIKTGLLSTANIKIGERETMNPWHMTMPSPFAIQKTLRTMRNEGCDAVVLETTSQGILQSRHKGINYDIAIFTNLTPEHIQGHGSFEKYREAKQEIFKMLRTFPHKTINGKIIPKAILANADSPEAGNFLKFDADVQYTFGVDHPADFSASHVKESPEGISFEYEGTSVNLRVIGAFNAPNALPAFGIAKLLNLDVGRIIKGLESVHLIPGRMEIIQREPFLAIVDYAHEKQSMTLALTEVRKIIPLGGRVIALLGAEGGGRDKQKRIDMGEASARLADYVVVSNVDPYEEDPMRIIDDIANVATNNGKQDGKTLYRIPDRREGIRKCLLLAKPGDVVIITGKGAEQSMLIGKTTTPWDDRSVVREELEGLKGILRGFPEQGRMP